MKRRMKLNIEHLKLVVIFMCVLTVSMVLDTLITGNGEHIKQPQEKPLKVETWNGYNKAFDDMENHTTLGRHY